MKGGAHLYAAPLTAQSSHEDQHEVYDVQKKVHQSTRVFLNRVK
jgi:hypothetical protein